MPLEELYISKYNEMYPELYFTINKLHELIADGAAAVTGKTYLLKQKMAEEIFLNCL